MARDLQKALDNVETTYEELVQIANEMTQIPFQEVNECVDSITTLLNASRTPSNLSIMSSDAIRHKLLELSTKAFSLSEIKDKSTLKQEIAETLRKEAYAVKFNETDGTVAIRENTSLIATSEEVLVEVVYDLVASMFKTKLDEVHRMCDALKTILMTKIQEAKFINMVDGE